MVLKRILAMAFLLGTTSNIAAGGDKKRDSSEQSVGSGNFTLFESGQVRPLALSPDGNMLFAVNTPDSKLEIYRNSPLGLRHCGSIAVGLEPVAVAVRTNSEVWVVNHLSDSISIVQIRAESCWNFGYGEAGKIVRTLQTGDEPRDIVFAGPKRNQAFVTTAHRGQNAPYDPQLFTPGIGRADVWVFDADRLNQMNDKPSKILQLFTDTPRALSVSSDGKKVYAAGFLTGNQTTVIPPDAVTRNGGLPAPTTNYKGEAQPEVGLIVKFNGQNWVDETGRIWDHVVRLNLPDKDVFVIDASTSDPKLVQGGDGYYQGVGTVLFNMATNPKTGEVFVSNTEAHNEVRFEGSGEFSHGVTTRGRLHEARITILGKNKSVKSRHLNKHINYAECCESIPNDTNKKSLATPMEMAFSKDGETLYVAAFGSSKVGYFSTNELRDDSFVPNENRQIKVSGGGPTGIVIDHGRDRMYVLTRFDNGISTINLKTKRESAHTRMNNPEPDYIIKGRKFLYDASYTSANGEASCSSCHVFGNFDGLAWDLGNPGGDQVNNPGPFALDPRLFGLPFNVHFRPLKGPMTTQSLRGMANHGPMHWRGDRTGGNDEPSAQPDSGAFNEELAFAKFNPAFVGLLGRSTQLSDADMSAFGKFILEVMYPPNPIRNLDNSLTATQQAGMDIYFQPAPIDSFFNCAGCHTLDPDGNKQHGVKKPGFFGTAGLYSFEFESQILKIPHLRNMYDKVGMFGMPFTTFIVPEMPGHENQFMGDQIRGFGFQHNGTSDTLSRFFSSVVFMQRPPQTLGPLDPGNPHGIPVGPAGAPMRRALDEFMMAFPTNHAPIVGQQVTLSGRNDEAKWNRVDLLLARATAGECDLVAQKGDDRWQVSNLSSAKKANLLKHLRRGLRDFDWGQNGLTLTCRPLGSGVGADLDEDDCRDMSFIK